MWPWSRVSSGGRDRTPAGSSRRDPSCAEGCRNGPMPTLTAKHRSRGPGTRRGSAGATGAAEKGGASRSRSDFRSLPSLGRALQATTVIGRTKVGLRRHGAYSVVSNRVLAGTASIAQTQRATAAGVKGVSPPCRRRHFPEEPWYATGDRFVEPALRPHRSPWNPRGLVRGHPTRRPRLDTLSFRHLPTRRPPAGKGALPLCTPHQGTLDPVEWRRAKRPFDDQPPAGLAGFGCNGVTDRNVPPKRNSSKSVEWFAWIAIPSNRKSGTCNFNGHPQAAVPRPAAD